MERIRNLSWLQKALLLAMIAMALIFAVTYSLVISREGILYQNTILVQSKDASATVYSGRIRGQDSQFIVMRNQKMVIFRHGEKEYGPYTLREDPAAVPEHESWSELMTGIEIRDGEKVMFRGGILYHDQEKSNFTLYDENGLYPGFSVTVTMSDGTVVDGNGNVVDTMEPTIFTILNIINGVQIQAKGEA